MAIPAPQPSIAGPAMDRRIEHPAWSLRRWPLGARIGVAAVVIGAVSLLRKDHNTAENPTIVINEAAARALGYSSPADAAGTFARWQRLSIIDGRLQFRGQSSSKIAAVVPDFSIGSVRDVVGPTAYYIDPTVSSRMVLRFEGGSVQQSLESVRDLWEKHSSVPF